MDTEQITIPNTPFTYSSVTLDALTSSEYTLVNLVTDRSGSVGAFVNELVKAMNTALGACRKSPRVDNLLFRTTLFNDKLDELHGYTPLAQLPDYTPFTTGGNTALRNAVMEAVSVTKENSKRLTDEGFQVNAVTFIITDGDDNDSTATEAQVKHLIDSALADEVLQGHSVVLIGINVAQYRAELEGLASAIGAQFVDVPDPSAGHLARLANFVSKSISSVSQSLATGAAPGTLSF